MKPMSSSPSRGQVGPADAGPRSKPLGQLLVQHGYLHPEDLEEALRRQRLDPPDHRHALGRICVEMGFLSRERLELILDRWGKRLRLGELLVNRGLLTPAQIELALEWQRAKGGRLGQVLIEMRMIDEEALTTTLAEQYDLARVSLGDLTVEPELARYVNEVYATKHGVVPIGLHGRRLTVAIHDPTQMETRKDLERSTGMPVQIVLASKSEVEAHARRLFDYAVKKEAPAAGGNVSTGAQTATADQLLQKAITRAASLSATALLLEPTEGGGRFRVRLAGAIENLDGCHCRPGQFRGVVRSLKTLARLDADDARRPQQGICVTRTDAGDFSRELCMRVSTLPAQAGEGAEVEFFPAGSPGPSFDQIGLSRTIRKRLESLLRSARGVFLITGPPGSGKRETLRACTTLVQRPESLIHTIEDQIVYKYPDIVQSAIDAANGETYASRLRLLLAEDPDAILCDRIDERQAAEMLVSLGRLGPLILGAVSGSNSVAAVGQMCDLGADPTLLADSLLGVLSQRLLRRVCPGCAKNYVPRRSVLDEWFQNGAPTESFRRGEGCAACGGTGWAGRALVAELWVPQPDERLLIADRVGEGILRDRVLARIPCHGQDALTHALAGRTTLEEALKAVPYDDVVFTRAHGLEPDEEDERAEGEAGCGFQGAGETDPLLAISENGASRESS